MKQKILFFALVMCAMIISVHAKGQDFQQFVLHEANSVDEISFINDEVYPWEVNNDYICSTNKTENLSKSVFSFTYTSESQTQVQFDWINYVTSDHSLQFFVDGVFIEENTSTSVSVKRFFLPAGTHVITLRDSVYSIYASWNRTSGIRNICVQNVLPLEPVALAEGSMPLTFQNDETWPWIISDGSIRNSNYDNPSSTSSFSTTFTITEPSLFSFDFISQDNYAYQSNSFHLLTTYINGDIIWQENDVDSYTNRSKLLAPGTYTIKWEDWISANKSYLNCTSRIQNISVTSNWTEVELEYAGTLGVEVLYKHDVLTDVQCLKVKGNLNSTDWATIKQMTNLRGLDLSEASFVEIPANQFQNSSLFNYLVLPEGVQTIGNYAFAGSGLRQLHIPSTVTSIGNFAFSESTLYDITFEAGTQIQSFGNKCFYKSKLKRHIMPATVTSIGSSCFELCELMDTLVLSDAITELPEYSCASLFNVKYIHLPSNLQKIYRYCFLKAYALTHIELPDNLLRINEYAFSGCTSLDSIRIPSRLEYMGQMIFENCSSLRYIELPSSANVGYNRTFKKCSAVETVVCTSAIPPSITSDPFEEARAKSDITLQVPSFAVATYKLDPYWYQFGTITEGEDVDFLDVVGSLMLTNNRRPSNKTSIRIAHGGQLTVSGAAPMQVNEFEFLCSGGASAVLLNSCPFMKADTAHTPYHINEASKWYFLTPLYDVDLMRVAAQSDPQQFVFRYYNAAERASKGTGSSWQNVSDGVLHRGQGYIVHCNSTGWMRLPSINHSDSLIFNTEDVKIPLQTNTSENVANDSWNFIGNPYPAYYDIWYLDFTAPITVWTGSTYKAYSIVDDSYALRPMEAFFVQKPEGLENIVFHREGRQLTAEISHVAAPVHRMPSSSDRKVYNLSILSENGLSDDARVVINNAASLSYEITCDASKFMSIEANCPQLYTIDGDGNRLAINERPLADGIVALGMYMPTEGEYTLSDVSIPDITLIDHQVGVQHDLHNAPYTFSVNMAGEETKRFSLLMGPHPIGTGIENAEDIDSNIDGYIYTLDGRIVGRATGQNIQSLHLPMGVYMIRSGNAYTKVVVR